MRVPIQPMRSGGWREARIKAGREKPIEQSGDAGGNDSNLVFGVGDGGGGPLMTKRYKEQLEKQRQQLGKEDGHGQKKEEQHQQQGGSFKTGGCNICGLEGHWAKECPQNDYHARFGNAKGNKKGLQARKKKNKKWLAKQVKRKQKEGV